MFFLQRNWSPLFFLISRFFAVIHVNVDIKNKSKERIGFVVVVFISKRPESYAIYHRNARVLEMQNFQIFLPMMFRCAREELCYNCF